MRGAKEKEEECKQYIREVSFGRREVRKISGRGCGFETGGVCFGLFFFFFSYLESDLSMGRIQCRGMAEHPGERRHALV